MVADQPRSSRVRADRPVWVGVDPSQDEMPRPRLTRPRVVRAALPPEQIPSITAVSDHLSGVHQTGRFEAGLEALLAGVHTLHHTSRRHTPPPAQTRSRRQDRGTGEPPPVFDK